MLTMRLLTLLEWSKETRANEEQQSSWRQVIHVTSVNNLLNEFEGITKQKWGLVMSQQVFEVIVDRKLWSGMVAYVLKEYDTWKCKRNHNWLSLKTMVAYVFTTVYIFDNEWWQRVNIHLQPHVIASRGGPWLSTSCSDM